MKANNFNTEHKAKLIGGLINAVLTMAGFAVVVYGIVLWAEHNLKF